MGICSDSLDLIDLLVLMNADSQMKSSNMLTKMVIETLKIRKEGEDLESATTAAALLKLRSVKFRLVVNIYHTAMEREWN